MIWNLATVVKWYNTVFFPTHGSLFRLQAVAFIYLSYEYGYVYRGHLTTTVKRIPNPLMDV